jgi:hypothetical protein
MSKPTPETHAKHNAKRYSTAEGRAKKNKLNRESWMRNYEKRKAYEKTRDKGQVKARNIVRQRIADGRLQRLPCEVCNDPKSHAHHEDYSKPLDVKWLCPKHHSELHKLLRSK